MDGKNRPRGLAFITYEKHECAAYALRIAQTATGIKVRNRQLKI